MDKQLIIRVAQEVNQPRYVVAKILKSFVKEIGPVLLDERKLRLGNLGSFVVRRTRARNFVVPLDGRRMTSKPRWTVKFREGSSLKKFLNPRKGSSDEHK